MNAPHAASDSGRTKTLALVGLGVVLLAFVASRFLLGGGESTSTSSTSSTGSSRTGSSASPLTVAPAVPAADATAGAPDATAGAAAAPATPVETFEVFTTKNPFQPLRVKAAPAAATKPAAAPAPAAVAPAPVAVAPAPVAVAPVASATTATGGQATEPVRTTRVALLDVFSEGGRVVANVRVNDTVSKVGAGDSFGTSFKVVSLDEAARCGRFLYGDDQFRMCRGEELLK